MPLTELSIFLFLLKQFSEFYNFSEVRVEKFWKFLGRKTEISFFRYKHEMGTYSVYLRNFSSFVKSNEKMEKSKLVKTLKTMLKHHY